MTSLFAQAVERLNHDHARQAEMTRNPMIFAFDRRCEEIGIPPTQAVKIVKQLADHAWHDLTTTPSARDLAGLTTLPEPLFEELIKMTVDLAAITLLHGIAIGQSMEQLAADA